jgi:hypothetical protein
MTAVAGTGVSTKGSSKEAIVEATESALRRLRGAKPKYGFLFASPNHDLASALATARRLAGDAEIIGCTTAGEITELGLTHGGVVVMLVSSDATTRLSFAAGLKHNAVRVAQELLQGLADTKKSAAQRDQRHVTTVLLTDGLAGTGEQLVNEVYDGRVQSGSRVVGGAAGDAGQFKATVVGAGDRAARDAAVALHIFGTRPWGIGVDHGLRSTSKPMRVTKAHENVVFEIDGEPAFRAYQKHAAARGFPLTSENASAYLIGNELGIHFFDKISRARAPLSVASDGSLTCAAEIPKGAMVSILDGDPASMINAARSAAETARAHLEGAQAAAVLLFDCVCRGMILKDQFHREVQAVEAVFRDVPIAGFLTYGEIARDNEKLEGWHNTTAVVVAIPA